MPSILYSSNFSKKRMVLKIIGVFTITTKKVTQDKWARFVLINFKSSTRINKNKQNK